MPAARICLVTTGGTIGEKTGELPGSRHLAGRSLLKAAGLESPLDVVDLLDLPSTFIGFAEMREIAKAAFAALGKGADGVVITHGTDTLEETAYFLDLLHEGAQPIIVTGAMRPSEVPSADGPLNLRNAVALAGSPLCRGLGVLVTLAGEIHSACEVTKLHSTSVAAFKSPEFGPLGTIDEQRIFLARHPVRSPALPLPKTFGRVEGVKCYAGMTELFLRAAIAGDCEGIVLETLGSGQVPPQIMPAIRDAVSAGMAVVAAPRSPMGRLIREHFGLPIRVAGDERDLLDAGVIFSDLQGIKARLKLALALGAGVSGEPLRRLFEHRLETGQDSGVAHPTTSRNQGGTTC